MHAKPVRTRRQRSRRGRSDAERRAEKAAKRAGALAAALPTAYSQVDASADQVPSRTERRARFRALMLTTGSPADDASYSAMRTWRAVAAIGRTRRTAGARRHGALARSEPAEPVRGAI